MSGLNLHLTRDIARFSSSNYVAPYYHCVVQKGVHSFTVGEGQIKSRNVSETVKLESSSGVASDEAKAALFSGVFVQRDL